MGHYIHDLPGRLRIKVRAIKGREQDGALARAQIEALDGVFSARVSPVTGSILIHYDQQRRSSVSLLSCLEDLGWIGKQGLRVASPAAAQGLQNLSDKVVDKLLESLVQRSAMALIAALI